ncbi:60S ribosomal protein L6-like Protein [Tribolium castaneum]|uniref:Large ribosomal subunit protein eL6 n=2 Tax=Tribolium castaneum TaxID=7070 RepID=D2A3P5_TRICA|nr:60S ribosomal protein L6-like Protein [Tribolium castaneum]
MAPTAKAAKQEKKPDDKKKSSKPRNYDLGNGVMRFSRTRMYHKKALYKFMGKKVKATKKPAKPAFVTKQIGGDKNGKERKVFLKKRRNYYPTQDKIRKHPAKKTFKQHKRHLRSTLTPGTVCILLAGSHKGKRVVFLKQLHSGLLLVTGPMQINSCPLRRISQRYVIGTQTKIDVSGVKIPETINDEYFRRKREKRAKKEEGDIFQAKKEAYKVSDQRKADQKVVDKQVFEAIKKHPDRKVLLAYLSAMFGLRSSQYPHRMQF